MSNWFRDVLVEAGIPIGDGWVSIKMKVWLGSQNTAIDQIEIDPAVGVIFKSRDEMDIEAALAVIQIWSDDFERDVMEDVLDAAFGKVANE